MFARRNTISARVASVSRLDPVHDPNGLQLPAPAKRLAPAIESCTRGMAGSCLNVTNHTLAVAHDEAQLLLAPSAPQAFVSQLFSVSSSKEGHDVTKV